MLQIRENLILDTDGRYLILRGVNLGGDSKIPFNIPGKETEPEFLSTKNKLSFVGRPFPIEEAETHFQRLKKAGFTFLRMIITWEAIEHEGPGIYDEEYLAYLRKILLAAEKEGISVFIDPHQDVWSRWTGGDGAPVWTLEKIGINPDNCDVTGAAVTRQKYSHYHRSEKFPKGLPYPKMIWPGNYNRYAAATMFSLFFAGKTYAPDLNADGINIQDWLQNHYIAAIKHAQRRLKNCAAIAGWGSMNEPHSGFIGHKDLKQTEDPVVPIGLQPTPWQVICAASGYPERIPEYGIRSLGKRITGYETFNSRGILLFKKDFICPWKQAGVWHDNHGVPVLVQNDYFSRYNGRPANFADDFLKPFIVKYINSMKEADEKSFFFIEGMPNSTSENSHPSWNKDDPANTVNAFHWYDGFALFTKFFQSWFTVDPNKKKIILGNKNVRKYFADCLAKGISITKKKMENIPCLLGEFGLAFDLNNRSGFKKGDYSLHEEALSMYYDAVDANLLHSTIWNYSASNTNKYGDGWNDEDLSIFSEGQERAAAGWKRPYPMATAGTPLSFTWNRKKKIFTFCFNADSSIKVPTIVYLPADTFGSSPKVETDLRWEYNHEEQQLLIYNNDYNGEIKVIISK